MNDKRIQSFVWHDDKRYFISTIERECSAIEYRERYNETMVWDWPEGQKIRGALVLQDEDRKDSIELHLMVCEKIYKNGITGEQNE